MNELPDLSTECFLITPIGEDRSPERRRSDRVRKHVIEPAATAAGFRTLRSDDITMPGEITDQIFQHVVNARLAVADLTGLDANVLYELGLRQGNGKPIMLIAEKGQSLPFDVKDIRTTFFESTDIDSMDHAQEQLRAALEFAAAQRQQTSKAHNPDWRDRLRELADDPALRAAAGNLVGAVVQGAQQHTVDPLKPDPER